MNLHDLVEQFLASKALSVRTATLDRYRYNLKPLSRALGDRPLEQVSAEELERWLADVGQGKSPSTQRAFHTALSILFNFAIQRSYTDSNPVKLIPTPRKKRRRIPDYFRDGEVRALLCACNCRRDRALLLVLLDTGIRRAEVIGLDVEDVDLTEGFLLIHGKGDKDRYVPIGERASQALQEYLLDHPRSGALWRNRYGKRLQIGGLYALLDRLKARAGLECRVHPHKFRHTFARAYLMRGDLESLRDILGHEDVRLTSEVYSHFLRDDLKARHRQCSPVDHNNWEQQALSW